MGLDLDKEEFLQRLDLRIHSIAALLEYHEKHLVAATARNRSESLNRQKEIEGARRELLENISALDIQIQENFERIKNEIHGG